MVVSSIVTQCYELTTRIRLQTTLIDTGRFTGCVLVVTSWTGSAYSAGIYILWLVGIYWTFQA